MGPWLNWIERLASDQEVGGSNALFAVRLNESVKDTF